MQKTKINKKLWIPKSIHEHIVKEANAHIPLETGGAFMGYRADNHDTVITDYIDPGANALYHKYRFCPDQEYQLEQIANIYNKSNGSITYLGDWHTHPNSSPELSTLDKRTLTRIGITPESKCMYPIMLILGYHSQDWNIKAVQFIKGKIYLWPFVKCEYEQLSIVNY